MNKLQKLCLYIKSNEIDGHLLYSVKSSDAMHSKKDHDYHIFETSHDVTGMSTISVTLHKNFGHQSYIKIEKITLNDIELNHLDLCARYHTFDRGVIKGTFGYMSIPGTYKIKIHQNAMVHNYILYFLSRTNKSNS